MVSLEVIMGILSKMVYPPGNLFSGNQLTKGGNVMQISEMIANRNKFDESILCRKIMEEEFGVIVFNLPLVQERITVKAKANEFTIPIAVDGNGHRVIKACADPEIFAINYPQSFNATMNGKELMSMCLKITEAEGLLICSATAFVSYPIYKDKIRELLLQ
ncbi:hypothetical protein [Crocosphaera sp.]|uniref:hypothetical protein n=1 Tax=Crocosphaera sp. TaxID=2729996 RepID=UPI003F29B17F|nr:hypothetical protein [Crocosphaera sp.]